MRSVGYLFVLLSVPLIPFSPARGQEGSAEVITYGTRSDPGVEVAAQQFDTQSGSGAASSSTRRGGRISSQAFVPNRCVGITAGGFDFDLFANSSCGSFAAPPTPDQLASPGFTPSPEQLAALASDRALSLAPRPRLASSPRGVGLTGLRTFVWLGEPLPTVEASASIPGLVVTAEARPVRYIWSFGDGSQRSTTHDGRPWTRRRPGDIGHVYETTGRYDLAVDVIWAARWRINDAGWRELGYFSTSAARSYPVREMRPMLVRSRR